MAFLQSAFIHCPYCGEEIEIVVDGSVSHQEYTEDCFVCCRPIVLTVAATEDEVLDVSARTEDE